MKEPLAMARAALSRLIDRFTKPRVVTLRAFDPSGYRFEIANRVEAFGIERFGGEEEFTRRILAEIAPGEALYDVGSCVGLVTIHAAKKGAVVVAFEPDPGYAARLATNLALNDVAVQVLRWAVSDADGEATLFTDGAGGTSPSLRDVGGRGRATVRTRAIDAALAAGELPPPHVVKLDIEGAEILALRDIRVLRGSPRAPRAIFLELHPELLPAFGSSAAEVNALLRDAGYVSDQAVQRFGQLPFLFRKPG